MLRILIFGDSIAYGKWDTVSGGWAGKVRKYLDEKDSTGEILNSQVYNLGIPGETTRRLARRIDNELGYRVDTSSADDRNVVLFQVGVNDANHNNAFHKEQISKDEMVRNLDRLVECANEYTRDVVFLGLMPIFEKAVWKEFPHFENKFFSEEVHEYAGSLKNHCKERDYKYIHLYSLLKEENFVDGIHPENEGHELIFQAVLHSLKRWNLLDA